LYKGASDVQEILQREGVPCSIKPELQVSQLTIPLLRVQVEQFVGQNVHF